MAGFQNHREPRIPTAEQALPGRAEAIVQPGSHLVLGTPMGGPFPAGTESIVVGMGCFWGAERLYWQLDGVYTTAVVYAAGHTPNPTYEEVCTGMTAHTEGVLVVFDPDRCPLEQILATFWENHDPTQFMGQGNDRGTQYRSGIYTTSDEQAAAATASCQRYQERLTQAGYGAIVTEIQPLGAWYYAEEYHQQYLAKNPGGYCNHGFCQASYAGG